MGSWKGRGNQYIQFVRVLYCKLPTNSKQLPAFPLEAIPRTKPPASEVGGESFTTLPPWPHPLAVKWDVNPNFSLSFGAIKLSCYFGGNVNHKANVLKHIKNTMFDNLGFFCISIRICIFYPNFMHCFALE